MFYNIEQPMGLGCFFLNGKALFVSRVVGQGTMLVESLTYIEPIYTALLKTCCKGPPANHHHMAIKG